MKYIMVVLKLIVPFRFKINQRLPLLIAFLLVAGVLNAATITTTGSGNWSSTVANAPWPLGVLPQPGDDVIVGAGFTLTVDAPFTCNSITAGVGSIIINNSNLTVTTDLLGSGTLNQGSGAILSIGGLSTITTLTATTNPNTVNYTGAAQTIKATTYHELNTSGSGVKSAGVITVNGALSVGSGTTFSVSNAGAKLFVGLVTINSGATWTNTTRAVTFRGGITNNGTFNGGTTAVYTFNTNSQALTGNFTIPNVTVNGGAVVLTNTNSLTVTATLAGSGRITQGSGATLNINGASTITNMTATASNNTVNYTGGAQTVKGVNYVNLGLSTSGGASINKTLQVGTTSITGNLTLSASLPLSTTTVTGVIGLNIDGDVTIGTNTTFVSGAFTHNIAGNWTNNGTYTDTGSTIIFDGTTQAIGGGSTTFNNVTLAGSGTKTLNGTSIAGLIINTGVSVNLTNPNFYQANSLIMGGLVRVAGTWGSNSSGATNQDNTFFSGNGQINILTGAFNYYSRATGNWNVNTTWSTTGFGGAAAAGTPGVNDFVFIGGGKTVAVTGAESCKALSFDAGTSVNNVLTINSGNSLTVSGAITIPQTVTSGSNTLDVGAGTLTASAIDFTATGSGAGHQMTISTGTATVSGNVTGIGASSTISFSGAGFLNVGGSMFAAGSGTLNTVAASTVAYTGSAQTVQALPYNNLTLSGSGSKTLTAATTIGGNLSIGTGVTFTVGAFDLTVTGTTNVNAGGTLSITSNTGTKTFVGNVDVNGTWTNTNEAVTFRGGIDNLGTFTSGTGVHTFNTNAQALTGTLSISSVTVTGVVLTNNGTLTAGTALAGTGGITQGASATLNIGGTSTITSMTATAGTNTVNYTGAAQTIKNVNYVNLGLSGSLAKTLAVGTTSITGNLSLSGSATTTGVTGLTIGGDVSISGTAKFTAGGFVHNVGRNWTNNVGALGFDGTGSTINFNGALAQSISGATTTFNDVVLSGAGTPKVFGVSTIIQGGLSISTGVAADLGGITSHSALTLSLGGVLQSATGTWGATGSGAANIDATYFVNSGRINITSGGNSYYSVADGPWSATSTWSTGGFGGAAGAGPPGINDFVYIGGGKAVTVGAAESCKALFFDAGTSVTNALTINPGFSLSVTDAVTIPQTVTSGSNILAVGAGSLTAGDIDFTSASTGAHTMTISTGTVTVSGNITGLGVANTIQFTGGAGTLRVGGTMFTAGLTTGGNGTVEYNGSAQTVQALNYNNLVLSGNGPKTLANSVTIGGNLSIGVSIGDNVQFTVGAFTLAVTGSTTVGGGTSGTILINSATGTKTFTGTVTIASSGTWNNTGNEAITFQGGLTNNGTFTDGTGVHTFNTTASQSINGTLSIRNVTVTSPAVLTNNGNLTIGTALAGTGGITQGASATLNIGGTSTITSMTATAGTNTVNYNGAGAQTVKNVAYRNLTLSSGGAKTLQVGTTSILGDFSLSGAATASAVIGLTIGGNVSITGTAAFTAGAFVHNVGGNWTNDVGLSGFTGAGSTINFNGALTQNITGTATTTFEDVTLSGPGTPKVFTQTTYIAGALSINSGVKADLGTSLLHTANTLKLNGVLQPVNGTWGSSGSAAATTNDTYFLAPSVGEIDIAASGNNYYSIADGPWNSSATWSTVGFGSGINTGTFPGANDFVFIGTTGGGTRTVTVTGAESCSDLTFDPGSGGVTNTLTINSVNSLTVSGVITIPQAISAGMNTMNVGAGTLTAGDIDFTASASGGHQMTISTGTANITGDVAGIGASSTVSFSDIGVLRVGGAMFAPATGGTLSSFAGSTGSTVEYNGTAQIIPAHSYQNLTLSGSGNKSLNANTTILKNLAIGNSVTFTVGAFTLAVTGTTTVGGGTSGTLLINSATGTKTFTGTVTIANGGTWSNTANEAVTFRGGISNGGTFTAGTAVQTFDTNASQVLSGTLSIANVTVNSPTVLTNNGTLTVGTALSGSGGVTQGSLATLNIGGTSGFTGAFDASTNANTVNYSGAAQTVRNVAYRNLTLSGSGVKTLQAGTTTINGNLTLSGTISTSGVIGLTIGGNVDIGVGTSFTAGNFTHSVAGNWINNGTFTHSNGTIAFNGGASARTISGSANTIFNDLIVSNTAGFTLSSPQRLNGRLTFGAGSVFNAGGNLTLLSTAVDHAASIGNLTGVTFNGNVTVQRFFGPANKTDRFISAPVSGATVAQLQAATPIGSFPVTGGFSGTSYPCTGCDVDGHNLRYYREAETGPITSGYKSWVTSTASTLIPGVGYDAYMWNGVSNTTVSFIGSINSGDINLGIVPGTPPNSTSITFTNTGNSSADGWNLVGNPYPSAILWDQSVAAGWTKTNINDYVYVYDVAGASWRYKDFASTDGNLPGGLIASGQGFWVYTAGSGTLTVKEGAKSNPAIAPLPTYYRTKGEDAIDRLKISLRSSQGPSTDDIFLMSGSSNTNAKNGFKPELGFEPIAMSFIVGDVKYGFYVRENETQNIPVYVKIKNEGSYEFSFSPEGNEGEFENYYLVDTYLGKYEKIISGASYSFDFTAAQANLASSRFYLTTNPDQVLEGKENVVHVACFPNPTSGDLRIEINSEDVQDVSVINSTGTRIMDTVDLRRSNGITSGKIDLNNVSPGIYMIRGYSKGRVFTEKVIKY